MMTKKDKYLQHAKSKKNKRISIDIRNLAEEYEKLLNKKFCYIFSGKMKIEFQFKMENFYHLLGFHKLTDVTVVKMIENNRMKKEDFFKYVKSGKITMEFTDASILLPDEVSIINIQDTKKKSELGEINAHRFQFFTESYVLRVLRSDLVIDFEGDDCDTVIEANKIFFEFITNKMRNLNLFIGYDEEEKKHYVSTFFLEMEQNKFLVTKTGQIQKTLKVLSRTVIDTNTNLILDFYVKWENVRKEFEEKELYRAQVRLKKWINSEHILSSKVLEEISVQEKLVEQYQEQMTDASYLYNVVELVNELEVTEQREDIQLKLMDYNIDADNKEELEKYQSCDWNQIRDDMYRIKNKLDSLNNKLEKHKKYVGDIQKLEIQEVILIYQDYIDEKLDVEKVKEIICSRNIFEKTVLPGEFKKIYLTL